MAEESKMVVNCIFEKLTHPLFLPEHHVNDHLILIELVNNSTEVHIYSPKKR